MNFKKLLYLPFCVLVVFTGCTDTTKKEKTPEKVVKKIPAKQISVSEKKQNFKDTLVPIATKVYNKLETQYLAINLDIENNKNTEIIEKLKKEYNAKSNELLLNALKPHPISILLAQAAAESAWLTSRFTKEANNIFGVWSFNKNEPRIAASGLRGDKTIYLKKYATLEEAVKDYYKNLGKTWAYKKFREQRILTNNPYILSDYLTSYSEKKEVYTELLKSMIKYNKFYKYDINYDPKAEFKPIMKPKKKIEVKPEVKKEVETTVISEIKSEVKIATESKIKDELKSEVKTDIKKDVKTIIEPKIKNEVIPEIKSIVN